MFRYHDNKGQSLLNLNDAIKLRVLKDPMLGAKVFVISFISTEL